VNSPTQITADYTIGPNSWLGYLNVTVTTPGGTSEPARFAIYPGVTQFGVPAGGASAKRAAAAADIAAYESFDVGIHTSPVANPDGSYTDAYLDVSFTDDKGRPVAVGDTWHSDMDNVVSPDDPDPGPAATTYSFGLQRPAAGEYVLHIKGSRNGSFTLEMDTSTQSGQNGLAALTNVPSYPGSEFELRLICQREPFAVDLKRGGLEPAHGAFSFAQPLNSEVRLRAAEKALGIVISRPGDGAVVVPRIARWE
jgi:hypothetical protein